MSSNASSSKLVTCPICSKEVSAGVINEHIDNSCSTRVGSSSQLSSKSSTAHIRPKNTGPSPKPVAPIFKLNAGHKGIEPLSQSPAPFGKKRSAETEDFTQTKAPKRNKMTNLDSAAPLAERLRPTTLSEFVGQRHLTGLDSALMSMLVSGSAGSMIFWGPPGCGKTTLARLIARQTGAILKELSATDVGVHDVRAVLEEAKNLLVLTGRQTILFLDEIHRFNKGQQDILLPYVEQGHIQLVGATTENPSFRLTGALLSRCRVFVLERLTDDEMKTVMLNALKRVVKSANEESLSPSARAQASTPTSTPSTSQSSIISEELPYPSVPQLTPKILQSTISLAMGDARTAISLLDLVIKSPSDSKEGVLLDSIRRCASASYDRSGDSHYDMISALHKSVRGSQGSAAMYWLARMLTAGEDPLYIARRMIVCASEDIGLADSQALPLAVATLQACQIIGMPECRINLAHIVAYLSEAPKSIRAYEAYQHAEAAAKLDLTLPVPLQMRNAPTGLMKQLGYGKEYRYNPKYAHPIHNTYLPLQFEGEKFLLESGDESGKIWDEEALRHWEHEVNRGKEWEGRK